MSRKKRGQRPLPGNAKRELFVLAVVAILAIGIPLAAILWTVSS